MYDVLSRTYVAEDDDDEELEHYGMPRRSGRYPWGSGENPNQHGSLDFIARHDELKKKGLSEVEIGKAMGGLSSGKLRAQLRIAKDERRRYQIDTAKALIKRGYNPTEIARKMGFTSESSVRHLLDDDTSVHTDQVVNTAKFLEEQIHKKGTIDVGEGVENELGISSTMKKQVFEVLEADGYPVRSFRTPQVTNKGQYTTVTVATKPIAGADPSTTEGNKAIYSKIYKDRDQGKIKSVVEYHSSDGGLTWDAPLPPTSVNSKRVGIRYAEDGGKDKDGLIEIRPGVPDLDLGRSKYAQVRIGVDGTHYLKGMCIYGDPKDFPEGCDIIFNTNKGKDKSKKDVLKAMKTVDDEDGNKIIDKLDPFGAAILRKGQSTYIDPKDGKEKLSPINKLHSEGEWDEYAKKLPSQFLAKQPLKLVNSQLQLAKTEKKDEFDEIMSLTNPTLRKHYLENFASECDRAAVDLKAAALPEQKYQVLIPVPDLKENEIYAPRFRDGAKLALIRFPHAGTFEIPVLKNNLKTKVAPDGLKDAIDAVGINKQVADRLSGADFDGDTALVIPTDNGKVKIKSTDPLPGLKNFDTNDYAVKDEDKYDKVTNPKGIKKIAPKYKQTQMGIVSNLITDMTVLGADPQEMERAVKHSMVVIDSEKHYLDYKKSYKDNNIAELKLRYQGIRKDNGRLTTGAATLLSRSKNPRNVPDTEKYVKINKKGTDYYDPTKPEGSLLYTIKPDSRLFYDTYKKDPTDPAGKRYLRDDNGNLVIDKSHVMRTKKSNQMSQVSDARLLMSGETHKGTDVEKAYADYANAMKALGNRARKELIYTKPLEQKASARITYAKEVKSIDDKLNEALKNSPRERRAQMIAYSAIEAQKKIKPELKDDNDALKKVSNKILRTAREEVGSSSKNSRIKLTQEEWNAIQAGAISDHKLTQILNNTDADSLREFAMPKTKASISTGKQARIKAMRDSGFTIREIADECNLSMSSVETVLGLKKE